MQNSGINKLDVRRALEVEYRDLIRRSYKEKVFKTEFRNNVVFTEAVTERQPITGYQPHSEQAQQYRAFFKEVQTRISAEQLRVASAAKA
ncbi:MAG: ParA family protein [Acidobacteria bacterium]|nr:ParA family protein [Acidobacteriota bacterium]